MVDGVSLYNPIEPGTIPLNNGSVCSRRMRRRVWPRYSSKPVFSFASRKALLDTNARKRGFSWQIQALVPSRPSGARAGIRMLLGLQVTGSVLTSTFEPVLSPWIGALSPWNIARCCGRASVGAKGNSRVMSTQSLEETLSKPANLEKQTLPYNSHRSGCRLVL